MGLRSPLAERLRCQRHLAAGSGSSYGWRSYKFGKSSLVFVESSAFEARAMIEELPQPDREDEVSKDGVLDAGQ